MNRPPDLPGAAGVPKKRWRIQWVWLVPAAAVGVGIWLAVQAALSQGPTITISFNTGEGLEAGKTKIKFKDVDIGVVKKVALSKDYKRVVATAELTPNASNMLVDDTRFWVERPRVAGGNVSGIGTLLSGAFVGMDIGHAKHERRDYTGLEDPPVFASDVPGREFVLKTSNLASLNVGSPVYFRRLRVGQVTSFQLDKDGGGITLHVFVNAPYDSYVKSDSRFWEAGGIDVSLGTEGVKINTQSLVSILIGGLAFETPPSSLAEPAAPAHTPFTLFATRADAMKVQDRIVDTYVLNFKESVRGLTVGAPVDFRGIVLGEVSAIYTRFDPVTKQISIPVEIKFFPERFTSRYANGKPDSGRAFSDPKSIADFLVSRGFRGQLKTGSLLTGQLYVSFDFFPNAPKTTIDWSRTPAELPTQPSGLQSLQESINRIVARIDKLPLEQIGQNAAQTLADTSALMQSLNTQVVPQAKSTLSAAQTTLNSANSALAPDSTLQQDTSDAIRELARTAASFRALSDYLQRHPEALLRGKQEDAK
ncbi:MlaD family protein [Paraburkholderia phymatum]|uniref:Mammalian cell entry related domain protein n=1 Tax=Paraburkholderia phymatum (strain DSM 17167 / CIP 108236 / LMG 21445 / STM815) TaxID=391038 RepID=B2JEG4_PARP8|nr:MlaD family protein [Paraburkholderia phymatum]ACC69841.1 Mammalian cell entry related domain protein [Paraburkholderia phymatum STM815]